MANVSSSNGLEKRPKLRFPGFDDPWKAEKLSDFAERVTRKNTNNETSLPLTISSKDGLVDQISYFNKAVASKDMSGYYLLKNGEYAYNKSYSVGYDFGSVKRLDRYDMGALSTLYICFALKKHDSDFINAYFDSLKWYREIYMISAEGARNHGLLNVPTDEFFGTKHYIPQDLAEQRKIADFMIALEHRIEAQQSLVDNLKKYKRGVMRAIFRDKSFVFSKATVWKSIRLGDECVFFSGGTPKSTDSSYYGGSIPFIRSGEIHGEKTELFLTEAGLQNSSAKMVSKGDLLIALYGATSGEVDISKIDGAINQAILCIRPYDMSRQYLRYLLEDSKDDIINTYLQGGQGNLSAEIIKNLRVDMPDSTAQSSVVEFLSMIERRIEMSIAECEQIQAMKRSLIQQLFI
jgi:type I restriction enzyme S subunit